MKDMEFERLVCGTLALLQRSSHFVMKCSDKMYKNAGITSGQASVLTTIEASPSPVRAVDLAQWIGRSNNSVSLIVERMINDGLVERLSNKQDRRSAYLHVTEKGKEELVRSFKPGKEMMKRLLNDFSMEELHVLNSLLRRIEAASIEELDGTEKPLGDWAINRVVALWSLLDKK